MDKDLFYQNACKDEQKVILLKQVYDVKRALAETLRETATMVEGKVLEVHEFLSERTGERITEPKQAYGIKKDQLPLFYQLRNAGMDEVGIRHPKYEEGYCTACVAEFNVVKHEDRIFQLVLSWMPAEMAEALRANPYKAKPTTIGLFKAINFTDKAVGNGKK